MNKQQSLKYKYLLGNLTKGLIWLVAIVSFYFLFKTYFTDQYLLLMSQIANKPILVISVFIASEVFFGIVPPELFMIWSLHQGGAQYYIFYVLFLGVLSYLAGVFGYFIGFRFSNTRLYQKIIDRIGNQFEKNVKRFGGFMVLIAAITPIPYSAICMVTGAVRFNFIHFLFIGISRFVRFLLYGYIIWQVDQI